MGFLDALFGGAREPEQGEIDEALSYLARQLQYMESKDIRCAACLPYHNERKVHSLIRAMVEGIRGASSRATNPNHWSHGTHDQLIPILSSVTAGRDVSFEDWELLFNCCMTFVKWETGYDEPNIRL